MRCLILTKSGKCGTVGEVFPYYFMDRIELFTAVNDGIRRLGQYHGPEVFRSLVKISQDLGNELSRTGLFADASDKLRRVGQDTGADVFSELAKISKALSDGDHSSTYPEVGELIHRAFDLLQYISDPATDLYYHALMELYRYLFDEWYVEQVAKDMDRSMNWTWKP
jgi:hypothetical protein